MPADQAARVSVVADSPLLVWRTLGALYLAGATIGAISLILPHPATFDDTGLWTNVGIAFAASFVAVIGPRRLPPWSVHLALAAGTVVITRAIYLSHEPSGFYAFFYVWVGLYAFFFFGRRVGIAHMAFVGLAYAWVLTQVSETSSVARWLLTVGTLAVSGIVIDTLVGRLRRLAARYAAIAADRATLLLKVEEVARTDELTGLPNRRAWNEQLEREVTRAQREKRPLCVGVLDLDRFKEYNDVRGHQAGDRFLKSLAATWRQHLRATDILARYGGEEFALALPGCDRGDGVRLIERLRAAVPEGESTSAGLAEWEGDEEPASLFGRADSALYQAKAAGRDRVVTAAALSS